MTQTTDKTSKLNFSADLAIAGQSEVDTNSGVECYPVSITARTSGVANHAQWGRCIHDFSGMSPIDDRIPLDWVHTSEVIGYADEFDSTSGNLVAKGALVALTQNENECSRNIAVKGRAGIPYQASIKMGDEFETELIPRGKTVVVNGSEFSGPLTIFRKWSVRGIAICPYGSDQSTKLELAFQATETEPNPMADTPAPAQTVEDRVAALESAITQLSSDFKSFADAMKPPQETPTPTATDCATGENFLTAFGDVGGVWFAQGKTFQESQTLFAQKVQTDLADAETARKALEAKLAEAEEKLSFNRGHRTRTTFQAPTETPTPDSEKKTQFSNLSPGLARFAASIKMPNN